MSYLRALYETYESHAEKAGDTDTRRYGDKEVHFSLLPISHTTQTSHIEITVTLDGELFDVQVVEKETIILPFTEESGGRAGKNFVPHILHDKLMFVAGDFVEYTDQTDKAIGYERYIKQLKNWCDSPYSHPHIEAIYNYVKKGTVIHDLVEEQILHCDSSNKLLTKWTNKELEKPKIFTVLAGDQASAFVRFNVYESEVVKEPIWKNKEIFSLYTAYYETQLKEHDVCYVTGEKAPKIRLHPNKIRNSGDKAKLISANDSTGFTYRGRFTDSFQAANISYHVSQKAHNALKWLIERQGQQIDGRVFLVWGNSTLNIPNATEELNDSDDDLLADLLLENEQPQAPSTQQIIAEKVNAVITGFYKKLEIPEGEKIYILQLDAATPGRLAVLYYREFDAKTYFDRLLNWQLTASWEHAIFKDKKRSFVRGAPALKRIAQVAYGPRPSDKVVKGTMERLLPAILDGRNIPIDIVRSAIVRASNPQYFEHTYEWEEALCVACSLVRKTYEKEGFKVALDKTITDRNYLFGRLLAVADVLERNALGNTEDRATSALRYMNAFQANPLRTWQTIQGNLQPYLMKLRGKAIYYTKIIDEIGELFEYEEFNDKALNGKYLLGYYSQRQELYKKKTTEEEGNES